MALTLLSARLASPPNPGTSSETTSAISSQAQNTPTTKTSEYIWPTNASGIVTSTFGEYRRTHFHAGIDISTNERTGYPVYATRDGYVANISISPNGYGKALTLNHADGFSTVYMHLERFNARLQARAEAEQHRLCQYPIEVDCQPKDYPVRRGTVIAYTGNTGSGPAHLHFEVRDPNHNPVNPLCFERFASADEVPPAIEKLALIPTSERSLVNGHWTPVVFKTSRLSAEAWEVHDTLRVTGEAGIAVSVRDQANGTHHRRGVYKHAAYVDDSLLFSVQLDRLPSRSWQESGLYFDWHLRDAGWGKFERLYADSPSHLPFYHPHRRGAGLLTPATIGQGVHRLRVVCTDFRGNSSELNAHIVLTEMPSISVETDSTTLTVRPAQEGTIRRLFVYVTRDGNEEWNLEQTLSNPFTHERLVRMFPFRPDPDAIKVVAEDSLGTRSFPVFQFIHNPSEQKSWLDLEGELNQEFVRVILSAEKHFDGAPSVKLYEGSASRSIEMHAVGPTMYVGTFRPLESLQGQRRLVAQAEISGTKLTTSKEMHLYPLIAGSTGMIRADNGRLTIAYDSLSVFKTVFLQIEKQVEYDRTTYTLMPEQTILNRGVSVSVRVDPGRMTRGLRFRGRGGSNVLAVANSRADSLLTGRISRTFGSLTLYTDNEPPVISRLRIRKASSGRPRISFRFDDDLSGVEYETVKMYIDHDIAIPEIDGEHNRAWYQVAHPLKRGSHLVTIRLADRLGNAKEVGQRLTVQ